MEECIWEVVGGADSGGIIATVGQDLSSPQALQRLSSGALVKQLELIGERLHFKRLTDTGPDAGWASIRLEDEVLLERTSKRPKSEGASDGLVALDPEVEVEKAKLSWTNTSDGVHITASLMSGHSLIQRYFQANDRIVDVRKVIIEQGHTRHFSLIHGTNELRDSQYLKDLNLPDHVTFWVVVHHAGEHLAQKNLSIVICGHVDSGRHTIISRLEFELGGFPKRAMERFKKEAERTGRRDQLFAFYMDRKFEERSYAINIAASPVQFYTEKWCYTVADPPGSRDFIKKMITGDPQVDVALFMVPADDGFKVSIAKGNFTSGEIRGQAREHARLMKLLGVKQIVIGINKMDCDTASYSQARFAEIDNEMKSMSLRIGWRRDFVEKSAPIIPISAWMGDNVLSKSENMPWWRGADVHVGNQVIHVDTVYDCLDKMCHVPQATYPLSAPMRLPISGSYNIKGAGDVVAGRVEQCILELGEEVVFLPTHTPSNPCIGKVATLETSETCKSQDSPIEVWGRHLEQIAQKINRHVDLCIPGDDLGSRIIGLAMKNRPRQGDVMVYRKDTTWGQAVEFDALVEVLRIPREITVGYSPIAFVRGGRSACHITKLKWKMGKETGGKKMLDPHALKSNEVAQCSFQPQHPFFCDTVESCESLSRVAFMDGDGVVMLGKILSRVRKDEPGAEDDAHKQDILCEDDAGYVG